jgi:hypothetical protein
MANQANIVQEGVDRVRETVSSIEKDLDKVQKRAEKEINTRRKRLEKNAEKQVKRLQTQLRKNPYVKRAEKAYDRIEKQTEKRVKRLQTEIRKNTLVKRAEKAYDDASKQFEKNVESFLGAINVASASDIRRVDRKLNKINKKLRELENTGSETPEAKAS